MVSIKVIKVYQEVVCSVHATELCIIAENSFIRRIRNRVCYRQLVSPTLKASSMFKRSRRLRTSLSLLEWHKITRYNYHTRACYRYGWRNHFISDRTSPVHLRDTVNCIFWKNVFSASDTMLDVSTWANGSFVKNSRNIYTHPENNHNLKDWVASMIHLHYIEISLIVIKSSILCRKHTFYESCTFKKNFLINRPFNFINKC